MTKVDFAHEIIHGEISLEHPESDLLIEYEIQKPKTNL